MTYFSMNPETLLQTAILDFSKEEISKALAISEKDLKRILSGKSPYSESLVQPLRELLKCRDGRIKEGSLFSFADLFAGIGGIRLAFERQGGECVFTSEWNKYARETYRANFKDSHPLAGDITTIQPEDMPDFDVLVGGFPCQPFSIAGVSKKNSMGRPHGFADKTQGTLFFDVARIVESKRPKAFLLENVKNLTSHDKGNTFKVIIETLKDELGYDVHYKVLDAKGFVPQHRERIIIVGFDKKTDFTFDEINYPERDSKLSDILHPEDGNETLFERSTDSSGKVLSKYVLSEKLWLYLQSHAQKHKSKGNGFGYGLVTPDMVSRTISARYYKDGSEILVSRGDDKTPRKLTLRECARLQGFPDDFIIPVSDLQAYKQFGNSVAVPLIQEVARVMCSKL